MDRGAWKARVHRVTKGDKESDMTFDTTEPQQQAPKTRKEEMGRSGIVYNLGDPVRIRVKKTNLEQKLLDYELIESGLEERIYDRIDYEHGRGTSFIKGEDGSFDNVTVGINKAARKEKVRKAIQESKRKARKSAGRKK